MQGAIWKVQYASWKLLSENCNQEATIRKLQARNCNWETVTFKLQTEISKLQYTICNRETVIFNMQSVMCNLQLAVRDGGCQVIHLGRGLPFLGDGHC